MQRYNNFLKNLNLLLNFNLDKTLILTQLVFYSRKITYWSEYQQLFSSQNYTCHSTFIYLSHLSSKVWETLCMHKVRQENHIFNTWWNKTHVTPSISGLKSHYEETVYFLSFSSQDFHVLNWSNSVGLKAELTLRLPSGFEPKTPGLVIQLLNY